MRVARKALATVVKPDEDEDEDEDELDDDNVVDGERARRRGAGVRRQR